MWARLGVGPLGLVGLDGCETVLTAVPPSHRAHPMSKPLRAAGTARTRGMWTLRTPRP